MGVLTDEEEKELVEYLMKMQQLGFPYTISQSREKVGILTQARVTSFKDGIPSLGWVKCFKIRHPKLSIKKLKVLSKVEQKNCVLN